jgi:hypothetical protein
MLLSGTTVASTLLALAVGGAAKLEPRTVTKASVYLVKSPSFLAPRASRPILRGQRVLVAPPDRAGWLAAQFDKDKGFIHLTYVSDRPGAFRVGGGGAQGESTISGNYNLAVGGFSPEAERAFRAKNPDLDAAFARLEPFMPLSPAGVSAMPTDPAELAAFVAVGSLRRPEEAGR